MLKKILKITSKHSPVILTSLVVTGLVTTVISAITATPKAMKLLEEAEKEKKEELTIPEIFVVTWKEYIPTFVFAGLTIACAIGSNSINARRNAALASLYSFSDKAYKEYKTKIEQKVPVAKIKECKQEIHQENINRIDQECIITTGKGSTLCYDSLSGRLFKSDIEFIKQALNRLSRDLMSEHFITVNSLYDELGLSHTTMGEIAGWHIDDGLIEGSFSSLLTEDGVPCLVMGFVTDPRYGYNNY